MKRFVCKLRRKHKWSAWNPWHGRFRYRTRECLRCPVSQIHDINLNRILELPW